jgi:hypothetical protein
MSQRPCAKRSRRVSQEYNLAGVLDLATLADFAELGQPPNG